MDSHNFDKFCLQKNKFEECITFGKPADA